MHESIHKSTLPVRVIYTGGTIGMLPSDQGLAPGGDFAARLDKALTALPDGKRQALPDISVHSYARLIDSSAVTPLDWQTIADDIRACRGDYAGVVVVHGTDTLSWTAASLALQLGDIHDVRVVVTGSMLPLESPESDARDNLYGALRFAALPEFAGVCVYFAGRLLRGSRTTKQHASAIDAFTSPNAPALGTLEDDGAPALFQPLPAALSGHSNQPTHSNHLPQAARPSSTAADYGRVNQGEVVRIALWPGMAAWQLGAWLEDSRVKGALLELWGAGNIADDPALVEVIGRAGARGKLIAAVSQCPQGGVDMGTYAAGSGLVKAGVLSGGDMTPEAAYARLVHLLALPLTDGERRAAFVAPWADELAPS